ncbi:MAG: hypothetical protein LBQ18_00345 [Campylobacteraceae bacterium]|jgi:hypothetical protein|nr:hypothetical protein [Campylobacteraceae bacterium]
MRKIVVLIGLLFGFNAAALADSPLTSTEFYAVYEDVAEVVTAVGNQTLSEHLKSYLNSQGSPLEAKIAVVNAIGWVFEGKKDAEEFFKYLQKKRGYKNFDDFLAKADGELLIIMAYLKALDNYFTVDEAAKIAKRAKEKLPKSYTTNIIYALILAQKEIDGDWCKVYALPNSVRSDKTLNKDMRAEAADIIFEYIDGYAKYCKKDSLPAS